ncbi:hypothetical protein F5Y17DRAFT_414552 [Xylariaceae sp. FL0594]|nr:hypothetical protein F5Y17DRAFT_414552 [Xylariaceae sp. FL0594]
MLGGFINVIVQPPTIGPPPKDVPPPTPVSLPRYSLQQPGPPPDFPTKRDHVSVVRLLQSLHRPGDVKEAHFAALGAHVHIDAPAEHVVPDPSCLPSASPDWDTIDLDETKRRDNVFKRPLSNGRMSPDARVYMEKRQELSVANQVAFRTVRRIQPEMGKPPIRLGNSYEFFRQLELVAAFWDDSSLPTLTESEDHVSPEESAAEPSAEPQKTGDGSDDSQTAAASWRTTYRTAPGAQMPAELRHAIVSAFVKLVAYDFGCQVSLPRVEPRLYLTEPPPITGKSIARVPAPKVSYFSSGCVFVSRTPAAREPARAGISEGPIAAVSARNTTKFTTPTESRIDFGRELIAALVTAQLRARQGKAERRFGENQWWATAKRWGGGEGGPIGREVEGDNIVGDKDAALGADNLGDSPVVPGDAPTSGHMTPVPETVQRVPFRGAPASKKMRKTLSMYDRYRMVRPPSSNWDKKVRYEAIGKVSGSGHDDVFVFSSLFHHLSILRVRVPDSLLQVLDGAPEEAERPWRSSGKLEIWRSPWFDFFKPEERLEAMRLLWGVMAWAMRKTDGDNQQGTERR